MPTLQKSQAFICGIKVDFSKRTYCQQMHQPITMVVQEGRHTRSLNNNKNNV